MRCKDVYLWSIPYYEVTMGTWGVHMYTYARYPIMKWPWVREMYICIPMLDTLSWSDHGYVRCKDVYLWSIPYHKVTMGTWGLHMYTYDRYPIMKWTWAREVYICIPMIDTLFWSEHEYVKCTYVYLCSMPYFEVNMSTWSVHMYTYAQYPIMMWPWVREVHRCIPMTDTLLWSDHGYVGCTYVYLCSISYHEVTMGSWGVQMYTHDRYPIIKWPWVREVYICIPMLDILSWGDHEYVRYTDIIPMIDTLLWSNHAGYVRCRDIYLWSISYHEVTMGTWGIE